MLIYKINFSLLTLFSLLVKIFCGRGLKGRASEKDENEDSQLYLYLLLLFTTRYENNFLASTRLGDPSRDPFLDQNPFSGSTNQDTKM